MQRSFDFAAQRQGADAAPLWMTKWLLLVLFGTSELVPLHLCGSWRLFSHSDRERSKRLRMWSMTFWSVSERVGLAVSGSGASREAERSRAASCWRALRSPLAARSTRWRMAASSLVTILRRPLR